MLARNRFLTASTALAGVFAFRVSPARAADFQYKLGHDMAASHPIGVAATEFAGAVRRESNGRLDIKVFPNSTLGGDPSMIVQMRSGALEMTLQAAGPLSPVSALAAIQFVGFAFPDRKAALGALDGALGLAIRKDLEAKNILTFEKAWPAGFRQLTTSTRPIRTVDDLAGLKLRVPVGIISVDLFKTLGASAVPIDFAELYSALQTHVVDGTDGAFINLWTSKAYEVQKYLSVTNHQFSSYWMCMNPDAWKALPSDLQTIVRRNANLYGAREQRTDELQDDAAAGLLVRYGMQMNTADTSTFRAKLGGYYAKWKREFGAAAWATLEQYGGKLA